MTPISPTGYVPGTYAKKRPESAQLASRYVREWEGRRQKLLKTHGATTEVRPCICFSRKIGVGALEVADLVARKIGLRVADREILEHMARDSSLERETIAFFDEMYPGRAVEMSALLFAEKSFVMGDYLRSLVNAVYALATTASTIFVGRGAHLLLPRERILAVRFICSDPFRVKRLSVLLSVDTREAERRSPRSTRSSVPSSRRPTAARTRPPPSSTSSSTATTSATRAGARTSSRARSARSTDIASRTDASASPAPGGGAVPAGPPRGTRNGFFSLDATQWSNHYKALEPRLERPGK